MSSSLLSDFHFFNHVEDVDLQALIELTKTFHFSAGDILLEQGTPNDSLFLVYQGAIEILRIHGEKELKLATITEKGFFGETSIFSTSMTSATVRAVDQCTVLVIKHADLLHYIQERPEAGNKILLEILKAVCRRLSDTNDKISDLLFWF
ncbi:MAG: cyclic nucleotide-binding domain-containing protein [Verrucomicrobiae bacterium]|nr:cyclic nucleotide-binding domain-containing protein [Verrucomicrobiae bacterium]